MAGRSHPIWNDVTACIYKGGENGTKSYGARDTSECRVKVGTSSRNSELLVIHVTTRREVGDYVMFKFGVDTGAGLEVIKTKWMHGKTHEWFDSEPDALVYHCRGCGRPEDDCSHDPCADVIRERAE